MASEEKFAKQLALAEIKFKDLMDTVGDAGELEIAVNSSENILKRLEMHKNQTADQLLESDIPLSYIQEWNDKAKGSIKPFRDMRKELKNRLDDARDHETETKLQKEISMKTKLAAGIQAINIGKAEGSSGQGGSIQTVKLEKYKISPFEGDYKDWLRFWSQFTVEVDASQIAEISKFNYLLEYCKRETPRGHSRSTTHP